MVRRESKTNDAHTFTFRCVRLNGISFADQATKKTATDAAYVREKETKRAREAKNAREERTKTQNQMQQEPKLKQNRFCWTTIRVECLFWTKYRLTHGMPLNCFVYSQPILPFALVVLVMRTRIFKRRVSRIKWFCLRVENGYVSGTTASWAEFLTLRLPHELLKLRPSNWRNVVLEERRRRSRARHRNFSCGRSIRLR